MEQDNNLVEEAEAAVAAAEVAAQSVEQELQAARSNLEQRRPIWADPERWDGLGS